MTTYQDYTLPHTLGHAEAVLNRRTASTVELPLPKQLDLRALSFSPVVHSGFFDQVVVFVASYDSDKVVGIALRGTVRSIQIGDCDSPFAHVFNVSRYHGLIAGNSMYESNKTAAPRAYAFAQRNNLPCLPCLPAA